MNMIDISNMSLADLYALRRAARIPGHGLYRDSIGRNMIEQRIKEHEASEARDTAEMPDADDTRWSKS